MCRFRKLSRCIVGEIMGVVNREPKRVMLVGVPGTRHGSAIRTRQTSCSGLSQWVNVQVFEGEMEGQGTNCEPVVVAEQGTCRSEVDSLMSNRDRKSVV